MQNVTLSDGTVIRPIDTHEERVDAVRLEEETWGSGFSEKVPAAILLIAERIGGVAAAAFEPGGRMTGFVFGLTGVQGRALVHWSDILAVRGDAQGRGVGRALKQYQRDRCRAIGVERMLWTFDPFVARNAHLNLNILGARVAEFVPDMYGTATNSPMHGSLGTDRFIVEWLLTDSAPPAASGRTSFAGAVLVGGPPNDAPDPSAPLPTATSVEVRVPRDYATILAGDVAYARAWRLSARRAFLHYIERGYSVTAFAAAHHEHGSYLLSTS